jgi:isopentenyl-diphosphate delta-isomerase
MTDVILVNEDDEQIGVAPKILAHKLPGSLHRAFSVHVIDAAGRYLIQRRATNKLLWPLFWSNACCSHPWPGEEVISAAERRLTEELGLSTNCKFVFKFEYRAEYKTTGVEHELCHVLIASFTGKLSINPDEVDAIAFLSTDEIDARVASQPNIFTPWFLHQWNHIRRHKNVIIL